MRYALISATIATLAFAGFVYAQSTDPYADAVAKSRLEKGRADFTEFKSQVRALVYAAECKVVDKNNADYVIQLGAVKFYGTFEPDKVNKRVQEAKQAAAGTSVVKGCQFWKDNPELVSKVRSGVREEMDMAMSRARAQAYRGGAATDNYNALRSIYGGF